MGTKDEEFIKNLSDEASLNSASEEDVSKYRSLIETLAEEDNIVALDALGYACYGGNRAFPCDWNRAEQCFLKLTELTDETFYPNTLGYIYYYGRTGKPDYEKAFYYFSIGAIGGVYESQYKIADMLIKGIPYVKNIELAGDILERIYKENLYMFIDKKFDCKFADIALRIGNYIKECLIPDPIKFLGFDYEKALHYYLQAKFALQKRSEIGNYFGDSSVMKNIDKAIEDVCKSVVMQKDLSHITGHNLGEVLMHAVSSNTFATATISPDYKRINIIAQRPSENIMPIKRDKLFVTIADANFCDFIESFDVVLDKGSKIILSNPEDAIVGNVFIIDGNDGEVYLEQNKPVFEIQGSYYLDLNT